MSVTKNHGWLPFPATKKPSSLATSQYITKISWKYIEINLLFLRCVYKVEQTKPAHLVTCCSCRWSRFRILDPAIRFCFDLLRFKLCRIDPILLVLHLKKSSSTFHHSFGTTVTHCKLCWMRPLSPCRQRFLHRARWCRHLCDICFLCPGWASEPAEGVDPSKLTVSHACCLDHYPLPSPLDASKSLEGLSSFFWHVLSTLKKCIRLKALLLKFGTCLEHLPTKKKEAHVN